MKKRVVSEIHKRGKVSVGEIHHASEKESRILEDNPDVNPGDKLILSADNGMFEVKLLSVKAGETEFKVIKELENQEGTDIKIHLIQSILPEQRMKFSIEKAVELDVSEYTPAITRYAYLQKSAALRKYNQFRAYTHESHVQSHRFTEMRINRPSLLESIKIDEESTKIVLSLENVKTFTLQEVLKKASDNFTIAVGPSGGWHIDEVRYFQSNNFKFVRLDSNILRSETAGLVVASIIQYATGNI